MKSHDIQPSNVNYQLIDVLKELDALSDFHEECDGDCDLKSPHLLCDVCKACASINEASLILRTALQDIRDGRIGVRQKAITQE